MILYLSSKFGSILAVKMSCEYNCSILLADVCHFEMVHWMYLISARFLMELIRTDSIQTILKKYFTVLMSCF